MKTTHLIVEGPWYTKGKEDMIHTHTHTLMLLPVLCLEDQDPNSKSLRTRQFLLVTSWSFQKQRGSTFQRKHRKQYTIRVLQH
jgi:hypothetical protein